ncbi:MAG: hypothetical protein UZ21_OP11001000690 [Microgenomates bacterium OLB22]|nr:MAG: hypothetical protein UZ21_OP11001000690 [Microgenomates bacterium OLB22]
MVLQNVSVNNIGPDEGYLSALKEKANAHVNVEVAKQKALQLVEQLNQEKAQTDIEVEQARRKNEVNAELAKTYSLSPEYYELERLRLLQGVVGDKDKIYFVPDGANLTMFLSGNGSGLVVPPAPPQ